MYLLFIGQEVAGAGEKALLLCRGELHEVGHVLDDVDREELGEYVWHGAAGCEVVMFALAPEVEPEVRMLQAFGKLVDIAEWRE